MVRKPTSYGNADPFLLRGRVHFPLESRNRPSTVPVDRSETGETPEPHPSQPLPSKEQRKHQSRFTRLFFGVRGVVNTATFSPENSLPNLKIPDELLLGSTLLQGRVRKKLNQFQCTGKEKCEMPQAQSIESQTAAKFSCEK